MVFINSVESSADLAGGEEREHGTGTARAACTRTEHGRVWDGRGGAARCPPPPRMHPNAEALAPGYSRLVLLQNKRDSRDMAGRGPTLGKGGLGTMPREVGEERKEKI